MKDIPSIDAKPLSPRVASTVHALGRTIRRARRARGMTQEELGERARVGRLTVMKIESGNPGVAFWAWASVMDAVGLLDAFARLDDPVAQALDSARGKRVRKRALAGKLDF